MKLSKVEVANFRIFKDISISLPDSNIIAFVGDNGCGKTSMLDAIYMDELNDVTYYFSDELPDMLYAVPKLSRSHLKFVCLAVKDILGVGDFDDLILEELSSSDRYLLTMAVNITCRLLSKYGSFANPLEGDGVVLIDEVERHLHPKRQLCIVDRLTSTFPNVQFIVTTNSPLILTNIPTESVFLIESSGEDVDIYNSPLAFGRDSNTILERIFDVYPRNKDVQESLCEVYRFIANGEIENAKDMIKELSTLIGCYDHELIRANAIIKRKSIIGK